MEILIGKNKHHNWELVDAAEPHDIWFHLSDGPSSHCILVTGGEIPDRKQLKQVAVICKQHSKAKSMKNVEINYTPISNIKKNVKAGPGAVIITGECKSFCI